MDEIWLDIIGYEGQYQVSNTGYVRSIKRNRILKPTNIYGYLQISLSNHGKIKKYLIHRLVAEMFLPNPNNLPQVNHKDENTFNNNVDNLEWCTVVYNNNYGTRNDRISLSHLDLNKPKDDKKAPKDYKFTYYKMQSIMSDIKNHIQQIISEANVSDTDANNLWCLYSDIRSIVNLYVQFSSSNEKIKTVPENLDTRQND